MAGTWLNSLVIALLFTALRGCLGDETVTEGSSYASSTQPSIDETSEMPFPNPQTTTPSLEDGETTPSQEDVTTTPSSDDLPPTPLSENITTTLPPDDLEGTTDTYAPHSTTEQDDSALLDEQTTEPVTEGPSSLPRQGGLNPPPTLLDLLEPLLRSVYSLGEEELSGTPRNSECGSKGRIIGGLLASVGEWPWAVVVKDKNDVHYCGGALISSRHILTAAHCIAHPDLKDRFPLKVTVGDYDLSSTTESISTTRWVHQAFEHSQYNHPTTYNNDIGVLVVQDPIDMQGSVEPVCLPSAELQLPTGTKLWVVGWGATMEGGPVVNVLRDVQVTVLSHSACMTAYPNQYQSDRMLCVGEQSGGKDACQGDSGGPLLYKGPGNKWFVVGVVSFGTGCGRPESPGVYSSVPFHLGLVNWALSNA